jgi:hypothetical protein
MAGAERRGLIEEKQLRPTARTHNRPVPSAERQSTGDPTPDLPVAHDVALVVMQNAAIAHDQSATAQGKDIAARGDAVLQHHAPRFDQAPGKTGTKQRSTAYFGKTIA